MASSGRSRLREDENHSSATFVPKYCPLKTNEMSNLTQYERLTLRQGKKLA